ncbi:MAG: MerR family transcriptional regulator [Blautia sp.]|nr:MerR family transcriptional regulator [Lachnoclostridium sp.]MCM1210179.1 MerR family transcriptional regulator [Blautia sp.]
MTQYLSIGKVAKLKNVSIKSLRYYDKIGILKPAFINTETNYRYYTQEQLYLLDAITLCIKLGIPLRDLNNYVENNSLHLQKLLYDGKSLAEERILEIHKCLEALQDALQHLSVSVNGTVKIPESKAGVMLPEGFYQSTYDSRTLLIVPLEDMDTPKYYGQYILKLFVSAQQLGLNVSYPSGVLHEYQKGSMTRYMFLTINGDTLAPDVSPSAKDVVRTLPAGDYICRRISTHMSGSVREEMKEVIQHDSFLIVETDSPSAQNKKDGYPFELQYLAQ